MSVEDNVYRQLCLVLQSKEDDVKWFIDNMSSNITQVCSRIFKYVYAISSFLE